MVAQDRSWLRRTLQAMGAYHPFEELRWDEVQRLGLLPAVLRKRRHDPGFPKELHQEQRRIAKQRLLIRATTAQVISHLEGKAAHIVLKGEPLAQELFPDPMMRVSSDIDLLVLPGDLEYVAGLVAELGFIAQQPWSAAHLSTTNQWLFIHQEHGTALELHWHVASPALPELPLPRLFDSRRQLALDQHQSAPVLDPGWQFIHLALHFHQHRGFARGLVDLAAWLDVHGESIDQQLIIERASQAGLHGIIQWPLHTMARLLFEQPPLFAAQVDQSVTLWSKLSERALRGAMLRPSPGPWTRSLQEVRSPLPTPAGVALRCALASLVDGGPAQKANYMLRPLWKGPHRYGRFFHTLFH